MRAFGGRDISALCRARSMETLASHRRAVVDAESVGPQNVPAGRMSTSLPVGFFAIDEESLSKPPMRFQAAPADRQQAQPRICRRFVIPELRGIQV